MPNQMIICSPAAKPCMCLYLGGATPYREFLPGSRGPDTTRNCDGLLVLTRCLHNFRTNTRLGHHDQTPDNRKPAPGRVPPTQETLETLGAVPRGAPMGDGTGGLQPRRRCLGIFPF